MKIVQIESEQTLPIRHQVLWPNHDEDFCRVSGDENGQHYGVYINEQLVCVASVFIEGQAARLRKFATLVNYQQQGIGTALITEIVQQLAKSNVTYFWCDARESALSFYSRFGMKPQGERFFKGEVAYFKMSVELPL
ncbi:GNAT family N-acetyltransferase [Photobacterium minamisatsumaniensis]|uniref:GNAT family N-acetyltransferase n=1 Tax=Photobacterium minamisatsumaniensis TaxID=2910233 RepID=UPI003D102C60